MYFKASVKKAEDRRRNRKEARGIKDTSISGAEYPAALSAWLGMDFADKRVLARDCFRFGS